jgi:hypothetical protein
MERKICKVEKKEEEGRMQMEKVGNGKERMIRRQREG